jgi:hypothetical protein
VSPGQLHRSATGVLSLGMLVIGIALIVQALAGAGGGGILRAVLGLLFAAAGALRLYVLRRGARG